MTVHPLVFDPIYKPKIWGGQRIFQFFDRPPVGSEPIGESWELADLEEDQSRVATGPARGRKLGELVSEWGRDLMGDVGLFDGRFPLLIKFLDAQASLSVQVHPNEAVARKLGGKVRIKHESWYILAAEPGGVIWHGLEAGIDADTFRDAMLTGKVDGVLREITVRPGDCYYLPSGTPHALGAGVMVAEVQTPSDITYRTYDWGRVDPATGRSRELHLEQAMECIDFGSPPPEPMQPRTHAASMGATVTQLMSCPSFVIEKVRIAAGADHEAPSGQPVVWIVLSGGGQIEWRGATEPIAFTKGNVILLPAGVSQARARIVDGTEWLEVSVPPGT